MVKRIEIPENGMVITFKFKNGQKVRDIISGVEGIIDSAAIWINGCKRYSVQPKANENVRPDSWWMDEEQLELIDEGVRKIEPSDTGGPSFKSTNARF